MNLILLANIIVCAGALGGFIYGAVRFFRRNKAVYAQMITLACGVTAFGRLYQIIRIISIGNVTDGFHLGILGTFGSLLFLFAANFGLMDTLCDDGSKELRKYRLIPVAAPVLVIAAYLVLFLITDQTVLVKSVAGAISFIVLLASYFNLKHLIIPDVDFGVIRCLRAYNLLALIYEFLCISELISMSRGNDVITLIVGILTGAVMPLITISVYSGVKKWTT